MNKYAHKYKINPELNKGYFFILIKHIYLFIELYWVFFIFVFKFIYIFIAPCIYCRFYLIDMFFILKEYFFFYVFI